MFDDAVQTSPHELHKSDFIEDLLSNEVPRRDQTHRGDFVNDTLSDVYSDFERTLERTSTRCQENDIRSKQNKITVLLFRLGYLHYLLYLLLIAI